MKKATRILVPLILLLFICASIVWYLFVYDREFTRDTLLSQARFQDLHGNSQLSSLFYDMAYEFSSQEEGPFLVAYLPETSSGSSGGGSSGGSGGGGERAGGRADVQRQPLL